MTELLKVVLATQNQGKLSELRQLLAGLPIRLCGAQEALGRYLEIVEDGETFEDNALLKARAVCGASGCISVADDSGLEVDGLGGRPGVRSARFAHDHASDAENNAALLLALEGSDDAARRARFRCALVIVTPWDEAWRGVEGVCSGSIAHAPRGSGGFGYDPLFLVDEAAGRSMAELAPEEKNALSHRGRAVRALVPVLGALLALTPRI